MTQISIGAVLGVFATVTALCFALFIVGMFEKAVTGDTEGVKQDLDKLANDTEEDVKWAPLQPLTPYIIGGVALVLTVIFGALGLPLVFKK